MTIFSSTAGIPSCKTMIPRIIKHATKRTAITNTNANYGGSYAVSNNSSMKTSTTGAGDAPIVASKVIAAYSSSTPLSPHTYYTSSVSEFPILTRHSSVGQQQVDHDQYLGNLLEGFCNGSCDNTRR
mmetsp:Transcript_2705/g.5828  ORF Transcript_2705/g.5828 Transcript_2705/m.5828 type:complete len:127 (-) Transcript_2705:378-758(-)|eukprot:CAMPEP_0168193490 /NCGR_PEP_ID=MMETSP0139_2-20121125/18635_1 /TAXON_ID=44445 /ORGANISM="Pseudo-nitzschia australis, Strain 10249 10 AB" /LENGTH=126 /DNA_ID=CAMNT_0008116851 /DNA_START=86 /DNA_END=466 /DNA_ORIENTATION=-